MGSRSNSGAPQNADEKAGRRTDGAENILPFVDVLLKEDKLTGNLTAV